ncbi:MAG: molybdopterin-dependent oxidoreductase, partial [Candidatus Tectomicrobia bacterium]|nr:molybdopterin-dependent oxidoreductase [Candidatus Tectomicrobia bacterium]
MSNEASPLTAHKSTLSRRDFLQLSALAALGSTIAGGTVSVLAPRCAAQPQPPEPEQWHYSFCRMCMMPECSTIVRTQNGIVTHVRGDPKNPYNQGTLCPRGQGMIMNLYNPYRVKAPLKRTNPQKGLDVDPGWVEISWDEALDTIAKRLRKIKSEDPRKLVVNSGFGSFPDSDPIGWTIFSEAFGTPNSIHTNGPLCAVHYAPLSTHGTFTDRVDLERCNYALLIGTSFGANWALAKGSGRQYVNALERGMKAVVVDPRCGPEASKATQWVPIRPGTELPFVLAVTNTIVNEIGIYDVEFLKGRTNGPYLITASGDYLRDPKSNKPLIWDAATGKAKPFDDPTLQDPALEGTFTVRKETVKPAFQILKEHLAQYTADWASQITAIPAKMIRQIARDFVTEARIGSTITLDGYEFPFRPVAIWVKRGTIAHKDGQLVQLASKVLNTIVGAMDVPGAIQGDNCGPKLTPGPDG